MSDWDVFCNDVRKIFIKTSKKLGEVADKTADCIRIEGLKLRLSERYEELGRIVYLEIKAGNNDPSSAEKAASKMSEIEALITAIKDIKSKKADAGADEVKAEDSAE